MRLPSVRPRPPHRPAVLTASILLLAVLLGFRAGCEDEEAQQLTGRETFLRFCSPCHGEEARGNGPVALLMRPRPPDLTRLAQEGRFDDERVATVIDGRTELPAHGTRQMPVWGTVFEEQLRGRPDPAAEGRLRTQTLVAYLRSIQEPRDVESPPEEPGDDGGGS